MINKRIIILVLVLLTFSCGRGGKQNDVDDAVRSFALTIRTFINFWKDDLRNCDQFLGVFDAISEETQTCDNGSAGSFQATKGAVSCQDGTPITAEANFTVVQDNCQDDGAGVTSTGTFTLVITFSAEGNIGMMAATDLIVQDLGFTYDNFETKVDFSNSDLSCDDSSEMTVSEEGAPDETCTPSNNCQACNL